MNVFRSAGIEVGIALGLLFASYGLLRDPVAVESRLCEQDECGWMAAGHQTFQDLVIQRRFDRRIWSEGMQRTRYGWMNPTPGKLVFGLVLHLEGYDLPPPDVFPALNSEIGRINRLPDWYAVRTSDHHRYLVTLRRVNTWIMALAAVALYALVRQFAGRIGAVLTAMLFSAAPLARFVAAQVGTDAMTLLLGLASLAVATRALGGFVRRWPAPRIGSTIVWFALVGAMLGVTVSVKLNGAAACLVFGTATVVLWTAGRFRRYSAWLPAVWLLTAALVCCVVFVALNPYLWDGPLGRSLEWLRGWGQLIRAQQADYPDIAVVGGAVKLRAALCRTAQAFAPWAVWTSWLFGLLIVAGLMLTARRFVLRLRGGSDGAEATVALVWPVVMLVVTASWLPLDFPRYYLPLLAPACALAMTPVAAWMEPRRRRPRIVEQGAASRDE